MHYRRVTRGLPVVKPTFSDFTARPVPPPHPRNVWLAYAAGLVDGEGTLCLSRGAASKSGACDSIYPRISVVNTVPACLDVLVSLFGGRVHAKTRSNPSHKPAFCWSLTGRLAASATRELLPYLVIKRRQAEVLIEFHSLKPHTTKNHPFSADELMRQQRLREDLRHLNKRGSVERPLPRYVPEGRA